MQVAAKTKPIFAIVGTDEKALLQNLNVYQQFLGECLPIYPLYALMFVERGQLSTPEISILFGVWVAVALVADIPTGVLADKPSRKGAVVFGYSLQALTFFVWLAFPSFWGYAIGFAIWGIGYASASGAFEAYLYEELKAEGRAKTFNKLYARSESLSLAGMVTAYAVAVGIGAHNYDAALILSFMLSVAATVLLVFFPHRSRTVTFQLDWLVCASP